MRAGKHANASHNNNHYNSCDELVDCFDYSGYNYILSCYDNYDPAGRRIRSA
jgi:hypothetical protein